MCQFWTTNIGMVSRPVLICLLVAGLAGCAGGPASREAVYETPPANSRQTPPAVAPPSVDAGVREASNSLLLQARQARADGQLDRADGLLQRAQRIDAANADVYLELAQLYSQRGKSDDARAIAERGLLYCQGRDCDRLRKLATR